MGVKELVKEYMCLYLGVWVRVNLGESGGKCGFYFIVFFNFIYVYLFN